MKTCPLPYSWPLENNSVTLTVMTFRTRATVSELISHSPEYPHQFIRCNRFFEAINQVPEKFDGEFRTVKVAHGNFSLEYRMFSSKYKYCCKFLVS